MRLIYTIDPKRHFFETKCQHFETETLINLFNLWLSRNSWFSKTGIIKTYARWWGVEQ